MYFKLRVALTQRRRSLLAEARERIQDVENADFAYASINGAIKIRAKIKVRNKQVFDVSSSEDIDKAINELSCSEAEKNFNDNGVGDDR